MLYSTICRGWLLRLSNACIEKACRCFVQPEDGVQIFTVSALGKLDLSTCHHAGSIINSSRRAASHAQPLAHTCAHFILQVRLQEQTSSDMRVHWILSSGHAQAQSALHLHASRCPETSAKGLFFMGSATLSTRVHPGMSTPWTCCACHPNIMQLGCRLIAWWLCRPPW